ncbi:MAG TPA: hypothetical protein VKT75_14260, partial [Acidobacteriaceae bacterium]|nr:hypothetical protein [Acidobacteriaceae bacterium]
EVYGIRRIVVDETVKTIRVEYDATRLSKPVVAQLLRRAGIDVVDEVPLIPAQETAPAVAPAQTK